MSSLYGFTMRKRWSQHWTKLLGNGGAGAEWLVFATPHSLYTRISGDDDLSCRASSYPLQTTQNW